jgi:hypothetical protein
MPQVDEPSGHRSPACAADLAQRPDGRDGADGTRSARRPRLDDGFGIGLARGVDTTGEAGEPRPAWPAGRAGGRQVNGTPVLGVAQRDMVALLGELERNDWIVMHRISSFERERVGARAGFTLRGKEAPAHRKDDVLLAVSSGRWESRSPDLHGVKANRPLWRR